MPLTLTVEDGTGLTAANTFVSRAEADAYFEAHLYGSIWDAAADATKDKALVHATRYLDSAARWEGHRATEQQALGWPRWEAYLDGCELRYDIVPEAVKNATCELAQLLIGADLTAEQQQDQIKKLNLGQGALEIEFRDSARNRRMPIAIQELLQGLGTLPIAGGVTSRPLKR